MKRVLNLLLKQEKKLRKASIPWIMLLVSTAGQASCSKLAKFAGMRSRVCCGSAGYLSVQKRQDRVTVARIAAANINPHLPAVGLR